MCLWNMRSPSVFRHNENTDISKHDLIQANSLTGGPRGNAHPVTQNLLEWIGRPSEVTHAPIRASLHRGPARPDVPHPDTGRDRSPAPLRRGEILSRGRARRDGGRGIAGADPR